MSRLRVSVIVIGDEILGGFVADTNSGWLAGRLQVIGVPLDRVVTVPDEYHAIDETLATELARSRPRLVITSGGIGSTPDDLTLESVAGHLGVSMRTEAAIDERITAALEWTAQQGVTVTEGHAASMRKMARVPAPAYLLPGVPGELRRIMTEGVEPALLAGRGEPQHVAEVTHGYPESTLNPVLDRLVAEYPDVHVGSYPGAQCVIRLKGDKARVEAGMELVTDYLDGLATDPGAASLLAGWRARWA